MDDGTRRQFAPGEEAATAPHLTALALIAGLFVCVALAVWVGRSMYADGGLYLLGILSSGDYLTVSWARSGATFLTQTPLIIALQAGATDIVWLARLYGASLYLTPLVAYAATTWLTRRDPLLFAGNAVIVFTCFFPISFLIMGEFHVLYALFWLAFVLLVTGRADRPVGAVIVLMIAVASAKTYEVSVLLCPLLMVASGWRIFRSGSLVARCILLLAMVPLAAGVVIGAESIIVPRDPVNSGQFANALRLLPSNYTLLALVGLFGLAGAASLPEFRGRRAMVAVVAIACLGFGWHLMRLRGAQALGSSYDQRAEVVPIIVGVAVVCGFGAWWSARRTSVMPRRRFAPWPLLLPALLVVALDLHESLGWRGFLGGFCTTLAGRGVSPEAFPSLVPAQRYGWGWTYPTLSVLLRPADSTAMVRNPPPGGWEPFDPDGPVPDIDRLKKAGGLCRLATIKRPPPGW